MSRNKICEKHSYDIIIEIINEKLFEILFRVVSKDIIDSECP